MKHFYAIHWIIEKSNCFETRQKILDRYLITQQTTRKNGRQSQQKTLFPIINHLSNNSFCVSKTHKKLLWFILKKSPKFIAEREKILKAFRQYDNLHDFKFVILFLGEGLYDHSLEHTVENSIFRKKPLSKLVHLFTHD